MAIIRYNDQSIPAGSDETLLDTLLKENIKFPHSCKIGTCQSCLTKLIDGKIPTEAQKGLKPTLTAKNYFLACQCKPKSDITIALPEEGENATPSKILKLSMLNHNVLHVRLEINEPTDFKAGQYINLIAPNNIIRSYSIANIPTKHLDLHIKLIPNGLMSDWLKHNAKVNTIVYIRGPMGDCFYHAPEDTSFPIVLAGTGTGLAPLIGIAEDALKNEHKGQITLIHGAVNKNDLYLHNALTQLQKTHSNFKYTPCILNEDHGIKNATIEDTLLMELTDIKNNVWLYICGPEETTKKLKMKAFLAGVPSASIYSDSFITTKSPP